MVAGAGDDASPRPNFDKSPARAENQGRLERRDRRDEKGSRLVGRLTRVGVARQAAVSARQCRLRSCERDAVIILEGGQGG